MAEPRPFEPASGPPPSGPAAPEPEPHVTLDPAGLDPAARHLREPLEEQLTSALQAATDRVRAGYHGQPADEVYRELLDGTRDGLHPDIAAGFAPDPAQLRRVAESIVAERRGGSAGE